MRACGSLVGGGEASTGSLVGAFVGAFVGCLVVAFVLGYTVREPSPNAKAAGVVADT
jgi:hypothetical protein